MIDLAIELENGELVLSDECIDKLKVEYIDFAQEMIDSLLHNWLLNKDASSLVYWSERFIEQVELDQKHFNDMIQILHTFGYVKTIVIPNRNWAEISIGKCVEVLTEKQTKDIRTSTMFSKYKLRKSNIEQTGKETKFGDRKIIDTGVVRKGFAKSAKTEFQIDVNTLADNYKAISMNLVKGMQKMLDKNEKIILKDVNYMDISQSILDNIIDTDGTYNSELNINDSRGRSIKRILKRVFNYISNKDARSLLVTPKKSRKNMTEKGNDSRYLFIAELMGYKSDSVSDKILYGVTAYRCKAQHKLDLSIEDDRAELHENIWLQRIYKDLDAYYSAVGCDETYQALCPIEIDATASMLQMEGALLNHKPFLKGTNCICKNGELNDMWYNKHISRKQFKTAMTPLLYGSSQSCSKLWNKAEMRFTDKQVVKFNKEIRTGKMAVANLFKEFIIDNVQTKEVMQLNVNGEKFYVTCNRYKELGEYLKLHSLFDTSTNKVVAIQQTVMKKEPDLEQFRRYFVTGLVHCLDSQTGDSVSDLIEWILDIHDAFIVIAEDAEEARIEYAERVTNINENREKILSDYFESIGIDMENSSVKAQWAKLQSLVKPAKNFVCSLNALK